MNRLSSLHKFRLLFLGEYDGFGCFDIMIMPVFCFFSLLLSVLVRIMKIIMKGRGEGGLRNTFVLVFLTI